MIYTYVLTYMQILMHLAVLPTHTKTHIPRGPGGGSKTELRLSAVFSCARDNRFSAVPFPKQSFRCSAMLFRARKRNFASAQCLFFGAGAGARPGRGSGQKQVSFERRALPRPKPSFHFSAMLFWGWAPGPSPGGSPKPSFAWAQCYSTLEAGVSLQRNVF